MGVNGRSVPATPGPGAEPPGGAGAGRPSRIAQLLADAARRIRGEPREEATGGGSDAPSADPVADDEAVRRVFLSPEIRPARRPPRRTGSEMQASVGPSAGLRPVGPGRPAETPVSTPHDTRRGQGDIREVSPVSPPAAPAAAPPAPGAARTAPYPPGVDGIRPSMQNAWAAVPSQPPVLSTAPADSTGASVSAPASGAPSHAAVQELGEHPVPGSVRVAADDFFAELVRQVERRP
jgi:hypothetical protein